MHVSDGLIAHFENQHLSFGHDWSNNPVIKPHKKYKELKMDQDHESILNENMLVTCAGKSLFE